MPGIPATTAEWENSLDLSEFETCGDDQLVRMRRAAAHFLADMVQGHPPRWLSLLGTSGAGKTFLADLILAAVKRHKLSETEVSLAGISYAGTVRMIFEVSLERMLQSREWGRFGDICNARFAVIDEIMGDLVPREISGPKLASLAERRLNRWTVFTANVGLQAIKEMRDARIASRMLRGGSEVIDVDVIDFNLR